MSVSSYTRTGWTYVWWGAFTAIRSHISRKLQDDELVFGGRSYRHEPQHETLFLTVVDVLLQIQHVVRSEQVATVRALDDARRRRWRTSGRIPPVYDQRRGGRRGGLLDKN